MVGRSYTYYLCVLKMLLILASNLLQRSLLFEQFDCLKLVKANCKTNFIRAYWMPEHNKNITEQ